MVYFKKWVANESEENLKEELRVLIDKYFWYCSKIGWLKTISNRGVFFDGLSSLYEDGTLAIIFT